LNTERRKEQATPLPKRSRNNAYQMRKENNRLRNNAQQVRAKDKKKTKADSIYMRFQARKTVQLVEMSEQGGGAWREILIVLNVVTLAS
jgi:hypothetical protein